MQKGIFPIRLGSDDKASLQKAKEKYGLLSLSDAARVSIRVLAMLDLPAEEVQKLMERYEQANVEEPELLKIEFNGQK